MRTEYEFVLPRGFVDDSGTVHRRGVMRLATARDELEPLRDPAILGPDDPRLTIVVLSRVVQSLGTLPLVNRNHIEGLFAADLAYLQDFYGVINFGSEEDIEALLSAQEESRAPVAPPVDAPVAAPVEAPVAPEAPPDKEEGAKPDGATAAVATNGVKLAAKDADADAEDEDEEEEEPVRPVGRRRAIEELPSSSR